MLRNQLPFKVWVLKNATAAYLNIILEFFFSSTSELSYTSLVAHAQMSTSDPGSFTNIDAHPDGFTINP